MCLKTSSVMINEKIGMEERPCPSGRLCALNHKLLTWAKWCGRGMRAWHFRGAWGKTNLVIPGSSLVLIKQTPRTKDRFLSQHMAFIHIIDVPYRDFLIFHMHMMYLKKMYQGLKDRITPHVTNFFRLRLSRESEKGRGSMRVMEGRWWYVCRYVCR